LGATRSPGPMGCPGEAQGRTRTPPTDLTKERQPRCRRYRRATKHPGRGGPVGRGVCVMSPRSQVRRSRKSAFGPAGLHPRFQDPPMPAGECLSVASAFPFRSKTGRAASSQLSLPLPGLSLLGLSWRRLLFLSAFLSAWSAWLAASARWLPEELWPAAEPAEPAPRGAEGRLGGPAASSAARSWPDATTAPLVLAFWTTRAKATPRTAPSSAPITTKSWPRRRSDRSTRPPRSSDRRMGTLPTPHEPKLDNGRSYVTAGQDLHARWPS
jgi:hypothetical protein